MLADLGIQAAVLSENVNGAVGELKRDGAVGLGVDDSAFGWDSTVNKLCSSYEEGCIHRAYKKAYCEPADVKDAHLGRLGDVADHAGNT